jgi:conjugal transfer mating pair stabilization protein TraN
VFAGEARECKKAVGGLVDCCQTPEGVSLGDYLTLVLAVGKLDSALTSLEAASPLRGAWETLRSPFVSAWSEVSRPFTSLANNLLGATAPAASEAAAEGAVAAFEQAVLRQTAEWVGATFGEVAGNALFAVEGGPAFVGGVLQSGNVALGGVVGTAMSWLMTAYTVYTVAVLLAKLLWECEADEFELGAKRELKSCHALGSYCQSSVAGACVEHRQSYCCFHSPLARILQEQVRPQLGLPWGSAKDPVCDGVPVERLSAVDWRAVNLDEWLAILAATGKLPTLERVDLERLTGAGSALAIDGTRADAVERSRARAEGIDAAGVREEVQGELWP